MTPSPSQPPAPRDDVSFDPVALLASLALPGLGHIARRQFTRGLASGLAIIALFLLGLGVGGIDVIDRKEDRVWFLGQALIGPAAFALDHYHQSRCKVIDPTTNRLRSARPGEMRGPKGLAIANGTTPPPGSTRPPIKSIGRANELGTLITTLAGMLNLIVILDAGFPTVRSARSPRRVAPGVA